LFADVNQQVAGAEGKRADDGDAEMGAAVPGYGLAAEPRQNEQQGGRYGETDGDAEYGRDGGQGQFDGEPGGAPE